MQKKVPQVASWDSASAMTILTQWEFLVSTSETNLSKELQSLHLVE